MDIKSKLLEKLKAEHRFWSFVPDSIQDIDDDILIEKTLEYLDLDEIKLLFEIYSKKKIKRAWLDRLVPQGKYLYALNRFLAWYLFDIQHPDKYLKSMETRHLNSLCN